MNVKAYLALLTTVTIWGFAPAIIRSFSLAAGPHDSMFIRLASVAIVCLVLLPFAGWYVARKDWLRFLFVSWIGIFGYFVGSIYGLAYITAGPGGILMATQPLMIAGFAAMIGTDRFTKATLIGFALAFAGTLYLLSGDLSAGGSNPLLGAAWILFCGVAFSLNVVFSKPLVQSYGPLRVTVITMILAAIPAFSFYRPEVWTVLAGLDLYAWGSLFYLGPIGTIFAVIIWNHAVGTLPPSTVGGSIYVIPILSALSGLLILGEPITFHTIIAGAIILAGVAYAEFAKSISLSRGAWFGVAAVTFAVFAWGTVPVAMRYLLLNVSPETALFLRLYPAGLAAAIIAVWLGAPRLTWSEWSRIAIAGLAGYLSYQVLAAYGIKLIPASWTGMLFGLEPIFIALAAAIFLREHINAWFVAGLVAALAGTAVLVFGSSTGSVKDVSVLGVVLVALSTLGWAIYTTLIRPISNRHGAMLTACLAVAIIALPTIVLVSPPVVQDMQSLSGLHWLAVAHVSIVATTFATMAWNTGLKTMSNSRAGMFLFVQPIVAAAGGILFLGESLSVWLIAGGALILAGVAVSQFGQSSPAEGYEPDTEEWPYEEEAEPLSYRA